MQHLDIYNGYPVPDVDIYSRISRFDLRISIYTYIDILRDIYVHFLDIYKEYPVQDVDIYNQDVDIYSGYPV